MVRPPNKLKQHPKLIHGELTDGRMSLGVL